MSRLSFCLPSRKRGQWSLEEDNIIQITYAFFITKKKRVGVTKREVGEWKEIMLK